MHWSEGNSGVCLTYKNEIVKAEVCLFGSSNLPETMIINQKEKATTLKTTDMRRKPMKNRLVKTFLRWVNATVITVSLGSSGAVHLQPNAF